MWLVGKMLYRGYYLVVFGLLLYGFQYILGRLLLSDGLRLFTFTVDTLYLHWNTSFPAITICEIFNGEKNWDLNQRYFGTNRNNKMDDFISDITFFNGKCYACSLCDNDFVCPTNLTDILTKFRSSCPEMIWNCTWNNEIIDCCNEFLPLQTELGICYSINSVHTNPHRGRRLIINRETGPGSLSFTAHEDIQVHIHASNEVPYTSEGGIKETVYYGSVKEVILSITEMVNDASVEDIKIQNRRCRFPWELPITQIPHHYNYYSHSTCMTECSIAIQIKYCNCTHHLMPRNSGDVQLCDSKGLSCLTNYFGEISKEKRYCDCLASCEEAEYSTLYSSANEIFRDEPGSFVKISMIDLPKERFVRHVVKTLMDRIISIGGIASLFFGISIISTMQFLFGAMHYIVKTYTARKMEARKRKRPH